MPPEASNIHSPLSDPFLWGGFVLFMLAAMVLDLGLGKRSKAMSTRTAMTWCAVWVSMAMAFNLGLFLHPDFGPHKAEEFFAGYLLEYSLSVDNLFVFVLVFAFFKTPLHLQHRALVWGIIGAMILRASMILAGAALITKFDFMMAVFGGFLVFTGVKLLFHDDEEDPSQSRFVRLLQAALPLADGYRGESFTVRENGRILFTRLFLVVLVIEGSDVIFAVDSVPAIFGVTQDPFIVFTSNMFAILGLRSLFFSIAGAIQKLRYLNYGLALVLSFIGIKMLAPFVPGLLELVGIDSGLSKEHLHLSTLTSLAVICSLLVITTILSLVAPPASEAVEPPGEAQADEAQADEAQAEAGALPPPTTVADAAEAHAEQAVTKEDR